MRTTGVHVADNTAVSVAVQWAQPKADTAFADLDNAQLRRWVRACFDEPAEITVRFVDEAEGRSLNKAYRGKDYATNVLTFPMDLPDLDLPGLPAFVSDIVLCPAVVCREAADQGKQATDHLAHLVIHGCLHSQGYAHETDAEAKVMEDEERKLLKRFKISDPYK